jgi:hypothetical protein
LNRIQAMDLLKEILEIWRERIPIQGYSMNGTPDHTELQIILPSELSKSSINTIQPLVDKYGYEIWEGQGKIVIF